ncbi:MAG TPA: SMI1/KNR4 family protein [Hymenobacter sp.]|jgi:hypothetical protein
MLKITPYGHASEAEIEALEKTLTFSLPEDYREFLKQHNGGRSEDQIFFVQDLQQDLLMHVFYGINNPAKTLNVAFWTEEFKEDLEESALIFGKEPGGGMLLYITAGENRGVYFWDHSHFFPESDEEEGNTYFMADSFADFCTKLEPFVAAS